MEKQRDTLLQLLEDYSREGTAPFHMPGHKRNTKLAYYLERLGADLDLTEIPGFDDLHAPEGILANAMAQTADLYGSDAAFFLVNGSTGGILAGIRAATSYGDRVLVARNCHKAVYHALELCGLEPVFLQPPIIPDFGCAASLSPEAVKATLDTIPEIRLVILTSPTYEGILSDVHAICQAAHAHHIPVLVDEAHGAHLGLVDCFPPGAISQGADLVIQSVHKTLPSLTQTAVLHVKSNLLSQKEVARQLGIFQTSSPSYLLMASLDGCVHLLQQHKKELFADWKQRLLDFEEKIKPLKHIQILGYGRHKQVQISEVYGCDPSKLVIGCRNTTLGGIELMEQLQKCYHIQLEMALEHYAVAMTGIGDHAKEMDDLAFALLELENLYGKNSMQKEPLCLPPMPQARISPAKAADCRWKLVSPPKAIGAVCGEFIWAYPPGIPLMIPGEILSREWIEHLLSLHQNGIHLIGTRGAVPDRLAVLELS